MNQIVSVHIPIFGLTYKMSDVRQSADWTSMHANILKSNPEHWPDVVYEYQSGKKVTIGRKFYDIRGG